jgi:hypothetical protein
MGDESTELGKALKEAIKALNRRDIDRLSQDPAFANLSAEELSSALLMAGPLMQDTELLPRFIIQPQFKNISPEALAKTLMLVMPLPYGNEIQALLNHPQLEQISPSDAEEIVQAIFQFQDRRIVSDLNFTELFKPLFEKHLPEMVSCAIRTQNVYWLNEILSHPNYSNDSRTAFNELIRWALNRKDKDIITLAIRTVRFNPETEKVLRQELVDAFSNEMDELAEAVVDELTGHPDFANLTETLMSWILFMSILYIDQELFNKLIAHKNYQEIPTNRLAELIVLAMSAEKKMVEQLITHPHFIHFSGAELGLLLESMNKENKDIFPLLIKHPSFEQIPEDHFHRMQAMNIKTTTQEFRNEFLKEPLFKKKYGEMLYEAIRRNECEFLSLLLRDNIIKKMVIAQLQNYVSTESYFVSEYTVKDVMREIFLTKDAPLINEVISNPLFEKRIPDLASQSIQFDDEELIESLISHPSSQKMFHDVMQKSSPLDRERIYNIFISNPKFNSKPSELVREVHSWKTA